MQQIYGITLQEQIYAPMVTGITVNENVLEITTDSESLMQNTTLDNYLLNKLNEDFIFSDNTTIVGFEISSNKIIFDTIILYCYITILVYYY